MKEVQEQVTKKKDRHKSRHIVGWIAVSISIVIASFWSYWGIVENFHEGWYSTLLYENLGMLFFQYLLFTIIFTGLACLSLWKPRIGFGFHVGLAVFIVFFFSGASFQVIYLMLALPLIMLGLFYLYGRPQPIKWAYRLIVLLPLTIIIVVGTINYVRVSKRINDGNFEMRVIEGNGITLVIAPRGLGWPEEGANYYEAVEICKYLSEDGMTLMEEEQNIWRLPSVDEAVRLMSLQGENCEGVWDSVTQEAIYKITPDKESPLWDVHSKIIYYWTSEITSTAKAYIWVYNGGIYERVAKSNYGYLSFRAVKDVE